VVDVEQLYRDQSDALLRALRKRFTRASVPDALIEDACGQAWAIAWRLREQIEADNPFGWMVVVAIHEVYALLRKQRFEAPDELTERDAGAARRGDPELALEAREALEALCRLKPPQCQALGLKAAGFRYQEIQAITGRSYTWVNRHVSEGTRALRESGAPSLRS
jgi:DNA-directed RNA polymerase specialized sigma24 family protein